MVMLSKWPFRTQRFMKHLDTEKCLAPYGMHVFWQVWGGVDTGETAGWQQYLLETLHHMTSYRLSCHKCTHVQADIHDVFTAIGV